MTTKQQDTQTDIDARLSAIAAAVAAKQAEADLKKEVAMMEKVFGKAADGCPIDPQERLNCESCQ